MTPRPATPQRPRNQPFLEQVSLRTGTSLPGNASGRRLLGRTTPVRSGSSSLAGTQSERAPSRVPFHKKLLTKDVCVRSISNSGIPTWQQNRDEMNQSHRALVRLDQNHLSTFLCMFLHERVIVQTSARTDVCSFDINKTINCCRERLRLRARERLGST